MASRRSRRSFLALSATAALCFLVACAEAPDKRRRSGIRVVLLGLDGASWNVMQPMIDRGALPNLERLVEEGVSAPMRSELPCLSIVLWTSVATGKRPDEHGITGWSYEDPETGEKGLMNASRRRVEALWNILTLGRRPVGFVNWWATWPAEPVDGYIVSEQFTRARPGEELASGTFPESLAEELETVLESSEWPWLRRQLAEGSLRVLSDRVDGDAASQDFEERYRQAFFLYGQDYRGERAAFHLLERRPHPVVLGYLSRKIDVASHYMWQFLDAKERDAEALSRVLEPVYRYEDALLGRLLAEAGPEANVIVLSDHGFTWESDGFGHEETAPDGIFLAAGPAFVQGGRLAQASLYDVAPTILRVLRFPVARDMAGRPLEQALSINDAPRFVDTYDVRRREGGSSKSPLEERIFEELEALGYVH